MSEEENVKIIYDTLDLCANNEILAESILYSIENQHLYLEGEEIETGSLNRFEKPVDIIFSTKRTLEAAGGYDGKKVAALNFASSLNPGGGVMYGARAQEESICRCSTLLPCLEDEYLLENFYLTHQVNKRNGLMDNNYNDDCIYTPNIHVFKSDTLSPQLMDEDKWYCVDIITCAAPNLYRKKSYFGDGSPKIKAEELKELHINRFRQIFNVALREKAEVLILGAFGCGAFKNPPEVVAEAAYEIIQEYVHSFETIEFAIYSSQGESKNLSTFKRVFNIV